jgi:type I restriction enzyme R subunit
LIRLSGNYEMLEKLDFRKLTILGREANNHLALINTKEALESDADSTNLLNVALEEVLFAFTKINEEELLLADQLKSILQRTRETLGGNLDQKDPEFISLKEELERLFRKKNLSEVSREDMENNIEALNKIYEMAKRLERKNALLQAKYDNDAKYMRIHKRLSEKDPLTESEIQLFEALSALKNVADEQILQNSKMLDNESYVEKMLRRLVIEELHKKHQIPLNAQSSQNIGRMVVKEYMNEYLGRTA